MYEIPTLKDLEKPLFSPLVRIYLFVLVLVDRLEAKILVISRAMPGKDVQKDAGNVFVILLAFIVASILFGFVGGLMGLSTKLEVGLSLGFVVFVVIFYVCLSVLKSKTKIGGKIG